jgi:hypothetical protein
MRHHLSEEQIASFRGKRIPPAQLPEIDNHLSKCAVCRSRIASPAELREALQRERTVDSSSVLHRAPARGEHLAYEQLEAYVDGRSSRAERALVRKHVEFCVSCADELRDLDAYKTELVGSTGARGRELKAWWATLLPTWVSPSRVALALAASAVIALGVLLERTRLYSPPLVPSAHNPKPAPVGEGPNGPETHIAGSEADIRAINTLLAEQKRAVLEAISQQKINAPKVLAELQGQQQTLLGESQGPRFEVLAPLGEVALSVRPHFRWQPVTGARSYSVAIFDEKLNPVESSGSLPATEWTPDKPLKRGQLYQWQVTAKLGGGKSVNAPSPPGPEAKFRVLDQKNADEIAHFQEANPESHIALGIVFAQAGLLGPGEDELELLPKTDPNYRLAQNLLKSIREIRHANR